MQAWTRLQRVCTVTVGTLAISTLSEREVFLNLFHAWPPVFFRGFKKTDFWEMNRIFRGAEGWRHLRFHKTRHKRRAWRRKTHRIPGVVLVSWGCTFALLLSFEFWSLSPPGCTFVFLLFFLLSDKTTLFQYSERIQGTLPRARIMSQVTKYGSLKTHRT